MTMHLETPALTMTGKKRGKQKFRNADQARQHRELEESWKALQKQWGIEAEEKKRKRALAAEPLVYTLSAPPGRNTTHHIPSLNSGDGVAALPPAKIYTGDRVLGIATLHKSNGVPVFSQEDAKEISRMRRG